MDGSRVARERDDESRVLDSVNDTFARVVVVVPTRNSARTLRACLESLRQQTHPCSIVVVDNHSVDATTAIAQELADRCIRAGPERSRQRNVGARCTLGSIVGFIDSDMVLAPSVVAEVAAAIEDGAGSVTVPERSVGIGYWAHVRAFERAFYGGADDVEAPRFFRWDVFVDAGGFDEHLDAGEDWDLGIRTRSLAQRARIVAHIDHLEGAPTYRQCCAKKAAYATGLRAFAAKHGFSALRQSVSRPYLRAPWRLLWPHPLLGLGLVALKSGEAAAVVRRLAVQQTAAETIQKGSAETPLPPDGRARQACGGSENDPAILRTCELVMPAYNEASSVSQTLESLLAVRLPIGWTWTCWTILDDASSDGTAQVVRSWSSCHPSPPLTVLRSQTRRGKSAALGDWHALVSGRAGEDHVVVVVDADVGAQRTSLNALLAPFEHSADMAVVWGADDVVDRSLGRRASAFQIEAVGRLAELKGSYSARAYGRFFAYRPSALTDFCWKPGQADDLQLYHFVVTHHLRVESAWGARVNVLPARGYRDFYLQTQRTFARLREAMDASTGTLSKEEMVESRGRPAVRLLALALAASTDFVGACAYASARIACIGIHVFRPVRFGDLRQPASSTKGIPGRALKRPRPLIVYLTARLALARRCRRHIANWPVVFLRILLAHLGWSWGTIRLVSGSLILEAPMTRLAWRPLIEVVASDVYRLRGASWEDPSHARLVLDIGAHVGSFTCALAQHLPGARFVCVEPSPVAIRWLRRNLALNGLTERVDLLDAAVADAEGVAVLTNADTASGSATVRTNGNSSGLRVRARRLEAIIAELGAPPDIVKLDCEGGEYPAVLSSALETWKGLEEVLIEYHPNHEHTFEEIRSRLEEAGLVLAWHDPNDEVPGFGMASFRSFQLVATKCSAHGRC